MHSHWENQYISISKNVHGRVLDRINRIREQHTHLIEEQALLRVIQLLENEWPYYENGFDKEKLKNRNSAESLESDFVNELTLLYQDLKKVTKAEVFFEHFFTSELSTFTEAFIQRHHESHAQGKLDFIEKYTDTNLPFLWSCILQNVSIGYIVWGSFFDMHHASMVPKNTEYIRKFLNLPSISLEAAETNDMNPVSKDMTMNGKEITHRSIICLTYLLKEQGVFSAKVGPAEIKKCLDMLIGEKVSATSVKEYNNPQNVRQFLEGVKNREVKEQLAQKLRTIADILD